MGTNETENIYTTEKINKIKSSMFEKNTKKINNPSVKLIKEKRVKGQINNLMNEKNGHDYR